MRDRRAGVIACLVALGAACSVSGPIDIDTKTDTCTRCRMSIDSLSHAAEIVTADGGVRRYDSLGCLLDDLGELRAAGHQLAGAWVIDYTTKAWLEAERAYYAMANLPTDHMGFGAAATATREAALKLAHGDATKVFDWRAFLATRPSLATSPGHRK